MPRVTQRIHMDITGWTCRVRVQDPEDVVEDGMHPQENMVEDGMQDEFKRNDNIFDYDKVPRDTTGHFSGDDNDLQHTSMDIPSASQLNEEGEESQNPLEKGQSLDDAILETVRELFSLLDHHKVSIACQKHFLKILY